MTEHEPAAQDIAAMDEAERAQWFYDNRERVAEESTPAVLDRVVSVRVSPEDLGLLTEAATAAGMKLSAWLRKVALEAAATAPAAPPAAVLSGEETRRLQDSVLNIVELLERSGIGLDTAADEHDRSLVLKSLRRPRKKKVKAGE
ncbi:plasmid mobilization protein [Streptosporangium sp. NPDC002721]|uniref:plasmid mobilization protein n=1 Tax=Streptosporangium sp. NPDC002721 TaxID=3366188 RepID=UPI0036B24D73